MKAINPESLAEPRGYNNGMLQGCGKILFVAGQVGWDRDREFAQGLVKQFDQAIRNVLEVVREAGGEAKDIGRLTIYVKDRQEYLRHRKEIGNAYRAHMGKHFPAMSLITVKDLLEEDALVEIEATAVFR
jgi:enamine deaminase RidA (YjgF/YER057c/UK114 family)